MDLCKRFSDGVVSYENVLTVLEMLWYECLLLTVLRTYSFGDVVV